MSGSRNDPNINCKYNYTYKITNNINNRYYIGVHRTNNIDDGYMGSGKLIKRAIKKYGIENFTKTILRFFVTYREALEYEKELVTIELINSDTVYNIREGGYGQCQWSDDARDSISKRTKKRWKDPLYREKMMQYFTDSERRQRVSDQIKKWIRDNPDLHTNRMMKINKNRDKINKTANRHRGMKRSVAARQNISDGIISANKANPEVSKKRSGKGSCYIYNPTTGQSIRHIINVPIPEGWIAGSGPKKNTAKYADMNKGSVFAYNTTTKKIQRFKNKELIPHGFTLGRPKK
jgi:hypothetical protein